MLLLTPALLVRLWATLLLVSVTTLALSEEGEGKWVSLFDGENLNGWFNPYDWGEAVVIDGEVHLATIKQKFFLLTEKVYSNFEFEAKVKLPEGKANSGFLFRCHFEKNKAWGYQAEVDPSSRAWSGGLYDEGRRAWIHPQPPIDSAYNQEHWTDERRNAFKANEWNQYQIKCEGSRIQIWVNGVLTTDLEDSMDSAGRIGLQHHGEIGQVYRFKDIRVREL